MSVMETRLSLFSVLDVLTTEGVSSGFSTLTSSPSSFNPNKFKVLAKNEATAVFKAPDILPKVPELVLPDLIKSVKIANGFIRCVL